MRHLVFTDVEVEGRIAAVRVRDGIVTEISPRVRTEGAEVMSGHGGALLPGLADHHIHLAATAAARQSIDAAGLSREDLAARVERANGGHIRIVGWHESEPLGALDADVLEALAPGADIRVQHRSGAAWVLSRAAMSRLGTLDHPGLERVNGRPTGLLFGGDSWLRERGGGLPPDLRGLSDELLRHGLTHLTDATPDLDDDMVRHLRGECRQVLQLLGETAGTAPIKLLIAEHNLPTFDELSASVRATRKAGRPVALHSVTRASLLLALAVLEDVGPLAGDRIEHAAVTPSDVRETIRELKLTVVTQPAIAAMRGDFHDREVDPADRPWLWPVHSLLAGGIAVGLSSDAPHGPVDPWVVMRAARDRLTPEGALANPGERITAAAALAALTTPLDDPGGAPRRVQVNQPADLMLCLAPLTEVLTELTSELVGHVFLASELAHPDPRRQ